MSKRIPDTEVSREFIDGMINRMGVSYCKYGAVADAYPHKVRAVRISDDEEDASLEARLKKYRDDRQHRVAD